MAENNPIFSIISIDSGTYQIEECGVRFFLLTGSREALLIDSGMLVHNAKEIAQSLTSLPVRLLNTHGDPDHIGSNSQFASFYMNPAEASNYYNVQNGTGSIVPAEDGMVIDLGDRPLEIISLPGHTPGSIAVLDIRNRRLFSGDPVQDGTIYMFGQQREFHAYLLSLEKLQKHRSRFDFLFPSHGTCPISPDIIELLHTEAQKLMNRQISGSKTLVHGCPVVRCETKAAAFLCSGDFPVCEDAAE